MPGKMVEEAKEAAVKQLLSRLPTAEELALLAGVSLDCVLVAMLEAARRRTRRRRVAAGLLADAARQIGVDQSRLEQAVAASPRVSRALCRWVAHHAWRPVSQRHAARLAGVARGTALSIARGRHRPEADPDANPAVKPRKVPRYYCQRCRRWVWLSPCVICAALAARFPEEEEARGEAGGT